MSRSSLNGRRRASALIAALALVSASVESASASGQPSAWIDQPLPGATVPFGSVPVTIHASDPGGIATIRVLVDGQPATSIPAPGGDLVTVDWTWLPATPGTHLLTVLAGGSSGQVSEPISVGVTLLGPTGEPTPAPAASATAVPSATPKPTPRPCHPPAPMLVLPTNGFLIYSGADGNPPTFRWAYRPVPPCPATSFRIRLSTNSDLSSPQYSKVIAAGGDTAWTWTPPEPLSFGRACTVWYWAVTARAADGSAGGRTATWDFAICP